MSRSQFLKDNEIAVQKKWGKTAFEVDAPEIFDNTNKKKFFVTFPFPYMNGRLHLGHLFSLLKAEIMARYYRTKGYNVLFPFGFHGTGIPITASANKLKEEIESNTQGKQFQTMLKMDIKDQDISNFVDGKYWLEYFPEKALKHDLPSLGCAIDYRRSFMTTDINPYFDSFVRWQFNKLNQKGYLKFGKKMVIYSKKDGQPCSDADRAIGEGIEIKELKIAFIPCGEDAGYYVTFDETAPRDSIVKSSDFMPYQYMISYQAQLYNFYSGEYFYKNCHQQPIEENKSWYQNIYQFYDEQNQCTIGTNDPVMEDFGKMNSCDLHHGSGLYTSNPNLNWRKYYEPNGLVISRSGDRCIVAETDQWYIMYDDHEWRQLVYQYVKDEVKFTDKVVRQLMLETIEKMHPWPFSRTFGMGTQIPFDQKFLIDSLSDSTIYMAFYTISHLIKQIPTEKLCDDIWDVIFLGIKNDISKMDPNLFNQMRNEFLYWYPLDLRVSGKDLIGNHLTMMFFNHIAIFGTELSPKMVYANGHILVDGVKMSKNKGNFITLSQAINDYGADVTRLIAGTAGDDTNDGNFNKDEIDSSVLSIYAEIQNWSKMNIDQMRTGDYQLIDQLHLIYLNKIMNLVESAYNEMRFRDIVKYGFYELQSLRNKYEYPHKEVLKLFLQAELAFMMPFIPHWCEYMSEKYQISCKWPIFNIDVNYDNQKTEWLQNYCQLIKSKLSNKMKKNKKNSYTMCQIIINNNINDYLEPLSVMDFNDKLQRKKVISSFSRKNQVITLIELITHIEKYSNDYQVNDLLIWLQENNENMLQSYLSMQYPSLKLVIKYDNDSLSDPLNPEFIFD